MADTGLPELPNGQVWRVYEGRDFYDGVHPVVAIYERKTGWFGRALMRELEAVIPVSLRVDHIRQAADSLLEKRAERAKELELLGWYPPKTLEDK